MPVTDEDAALKAIETLQHLSDEQKQAQDAINAILHDGEPFVDIHELFANYNVLYFRNLLIPRVEVLWSPRLTLYVRLIPDHVPPSSPELAAPGYANCPKTRPLPSLRGFA